MQEEESPNNRMKKEAFFSTKHLGDSVTDRMEFVDGKKVKC